MSNKYEITGSIIVIEDTQTFASGFAKRSFVIRTQEDKYPQDIKLDALKDDCARLDAYEVGDVISVSFNLRGNEYQGKYYVSLQAWKFEEIWRRQSSPSPKKSKPAPEPLAALDDALDDGSEDDIPF